MSNEALDRKCMIAIRSGDFEAFERLYHQYYRRLFGFFYRLCWDAEHSEDLLQETFIRLWKGAKYFDPKAPLAPYLYRIGKNAWIDFERRHGNRKTWDANNDIQSDTEKLREALSVNDPATTMKLPSRKERPKLLGGDQDLVAADPEEHPDTKMRQKEVEATVRRALRSIDTEKRLVIVLSFYQGLKIAEIAEILDIPLGTVKSRLFHAERKLRGLLGHLVG